MFQLLGRGSYGTVRLARDLERNTLCVSRVLHSLQRCLSVGPRRSTAVSHPSRPSQTGHWRPVLCALPLSIHIHPTPTPPPPLPPSPQAIKCMSKRKLRRLTFGRRPRTASSSTPSTPLAAHAASAASSQMASGGDTEHLNREITILKRIRHKHIVRLLEVINDPAHDIVYMALELLRHGVVMDMSKPETVTQLSERRACTYLRQVLLGLEYLHSERIVHRDIKPSNLLLHSESCVKITDFGASHYFEDPATDFRLAQTAGTPAFYAPECVKSSGTPFDTRAVDIWAAGVTLYCFLFARTPFRGSNAYDIYQRVADDPVPLTGVPRKHPLSAQALGVLRRMLHKNPERRATMKVLRNDPWLTRFGTEELPPREDNVAGLLDEPATVTAAAAVAAAAAEERRRSSGGTSSDGTSSSGATSSSATASTAGATASAQASNGGVGPMPAGALSPQRLRKVLSPAAASTSAVAAMTPQKRGSSEACRDAAVQRSGSVRSHQGRSQRSSTRRRSSNSRTVSLLHFGLGRKPPCPSIFVVVLIKSMLRRRSFRAPFAALRARLRAEQESELLDADDDYTSDGRPTSRSSNRSVPASAPAHSRKMFFSGPADMDPLMEMASEQGSPGLGPAMSPGLSPGLSPAGAAARPAAAAQLCSPLLSPSRRRSFFDFQVQSSPGSAASREVEAGVGVVVVHPRPTLTSRHGSGILAVGPAPRPSIDAAFDMSAMAAAAAAAEAAHGKEGSPGGPMRARCCSDIGPRPRTRTNDLLRHEHAAHRRLTAAIQAMQLQEESSSAPSSAKSSQAEVGSGGQGGGVGVDDADSVPAPVVAEAHGAPRPDAEARVTLLSSPSAAAAAAQELQQSHVARTAQAAREGLPVRAPHFKYAQAHRNNRLKSKLQGRIAAGRVSHL